MRRRYIVWLLILAAAIAYAYIVGSWWIEGSERFDQNMREHCSSLKLNDPIPDGCREL